MEDFDFMEIFENYSSATNMKRFCEFEDSTAATRKTKIEFCDSEYENKQNETIIMAFDMKTKKWSL